MADKNNKQDHVLAAWRNRVQLGVRRFLDEGSCLTVVCCLLAHTRIHLLTRAPVILA